MTDRESKLPAETHDQRSLVSLSTPCSRQKGPLCDLQLASPEILVPASIHIMRASFFPILGVFFCFFFYFLEKKKI
jgi:hypothetical protein